MVTANEADPLFDLPDVGRWPAPRIMAIDLAAKRTGLACCADGRTDVWTFVTTATGHARENAIKTELSRCIGLYRPQVILLEDIYAPKPVTASFMLLAFLHGVIRNHLFTVWGKEAPRVIISTAHLKIFAIGKGSGLGVTKTAAVLAIERRYRHLVQIADDDQADAFTMMAMARHQYGHPLSTVDGKAVPKTHLRALSMVKWPTIAR
jgi:Holliday junction resolvasome RuvABC endonuclease subunit